jgi:hypothetical protein
MGDFDVLATFRKYARRVGFVHFKEVDMNRPWEVTAGYAGPSTWSDTGAYSVAASVDHVAALFARRAGNCWPSRPHCLGGLKRVRAAGGTYLRRAPAGLHEKLSGCGPHLA